MGAAIAASSEADQSFLASGRNLRTCERALVLSIPRHRLPGATIELFLSAFRDLDAAKSLFRRALRYGAHLQPPAINTDQAPTYASAIPALHRTGIIGRRCRHRPVQCLNNIIIQDHRAIQKRVNAKQGFRKFSGCLAGTGSVKIATTAQSTLKRPPAWFRPARARQTDPLLALTLRLAQLAALSEKALPCQAVAALAAVVAPVQQHVV